MRTRLRSKVTLLFMTCAVLLAVPAMALAAELVTSELDTVTPNAVTVEQGGTTNFNIGMIATGSMASTINSANASTATVDTVYSLNDTGAVSGSTPSSAFKFYSSGTGCDGQNCDVTWTGAPTPYSVGASVSAASNTPVGDYSLVLSDSANTTDLINPGAQGGKLSDTTATTITVHVVAPTVTNHAPTVSNTAQDANGVEGDTLTTSGAFSDQDGDTLSITKQSGAGTVTPSTTNPGQWSWSLPTTDNGSGTVVVKADDGKGGTVTNSFDWTATNATPKVGALNVTDPNNGTACLSGNTINLGFSFTDAGSADTHKATIAWGDGSTDTMVDPATSPVSGKQHTYKGMGPYTITVTVEDDDAGSGNETKSQSFHYNVGNTLLSPVNADNSSVFKLGSTIPLKVNITDCNGVGVAGLSPQIKMILASSNTPVAGENEGISTQPNDTNWVMRGDGSGQYIYNLASKSLPDSSATYKAQITDHGHSVTTQNGFGLKAK